MKTRVWKYGANYYPQYRKWFIWRCIVRNKDYFVYFLSKEEAIDFLNGPWDQYEQVVWKSK